MGEGEGTRLARLRQGLYRFFAASLLYPDAERLALLIEASRLLDAEDLHAFAFYGPWRRLRGALEDLLDRAEVGLEEEYVRLLLVSGDGALCPPHEAFYLAPPGPAIGLVLAELEQEYARIGVSPSGELRSFPDHAAVELEAMAFLCDGEARARENKGPGEVDGALADQRAFLGQHLGRWFPIFTGRVMKLSAGSFYAAVVGAADAYVRHDLDLLSLLAKGVRGRG